MKPSPGDEIARITITLYGDGQMGISGNLGDVKLALQMIDHARDAVNSQWTKRRVDGGLHSMPPALVIPGRDVVTDHHPLYPVSPAGDKP